MPVVTRIQIALTALLATLAVVWAHPLPGAPWLQCALFFAAILLSSRYKIALPQGDGSMSLSFFFVLLAIAELSPLQAITAAAISIIAQYRPRTRSAFSLVQIVFTLANTVCATAGACIGYRAMLQAHLPRGLSLTLAAVVYFFLSTYPVAAVIASATGQRATRLWQNELATCLPFYVAGAILAGISHLLGDKFGWPVSLAPLPLIYLVYRAYALQLTRLKRRQQHLDDTEALHLRTIEGLAMAIEAKDQNTHDHLFRLRDYGEDIGQFLGLSRSEMQALRTAAFLHDIGKLAVPEHIINKPGKLTPDEFDKMKIHPVVGADILERIRFPYPVAPIVRSHHEWYNGAGYPDGLAGEAIPIGARILTVIDCFDAMVSDRPYRKAMPIPEALAVIKALAGSQFDPRVVAALEHRYLDADTHVAPATAQTFLALNQAIDLPLGQAPDEDELELTAVPHLAPASAIPRENRLRRDDRLGRGPSGMESLTLIAAASQEAQTLFEMSQSMGNSLSLNETISVMASRLHRLISFDSCALYLKVDDSLVIQYIDGENARSFALSPVPIGEGISGWVAQSGKPIVNGNAALEPSYHRKFGLSGELRATLAMPLFDLDQKVLGVFTLYSARAESFSRDHLRILQATESKLSLSVQNALHFRRAESDAETDFLTQLPNARHLFVALDAALDRARHQAASLGVIVCDLNRFKQVNDRFGHLAGNNLLALAAEGFRRVCRPCDIVARTGGDEFVFVIRDLTEDSAAHVLDSIANAVITAGRRSGVDVQVTASLGAAFFPQDCDSAEDILALADRRMYHDKQQKHESIPPSRVSPIRAAVAS